MKTPRAIFRHTTIGFAVVSLLSSVAVFATTGEFMAKSIRAQRQAAPHTDRIIVKLRSMQPAFMARNIHAETVHNLGATAGIALAMHRPMSGGAHVLKLPTKMSVADAESYASALRSHPDVIYAEVDRVRRAELVPNDPDFGGQAVTLCLDNQIPCLNEIPHNSEQWYLKNGPGGINAPAAWDITTGNPNIRVAVLDTGIAPHSEMTGRTIGGYDFIFDIPSANDKSARDADPRDPGDWISTADITNKICGPSPDGLVPGDEVDSSWHGTSVAGIIGAASNNLAGIAGVNWQSPIVPVRVLGKCGGLDSDITDAIRYAAGVADPAIPNNPTPARVINLSLGGADSSGCGPLYTLAIADATAKNAVIIASAGNGGADGFGDNASGHVPGGSCAGIVAVAGTGKFGERAGYSNFGTSVTISAPGGNKYNAANWDGTIWHILNNSLTSPNPAPDGDEFATGVGTSFSAPVVSGVVSLMLSANPGLTTAQVISILQATAKPFPVLTQAQKNAGLIQCTTSTCGAGIVNAAAAVAEAQRQPGGIQTNNNSGGGGGCSLTTANSQTDLSLVLLLGISLLWRVQGKCAEKLRPRITANGLTQS